MSLLTNLRGLFRRKPKVTFTEHIGAAITDILARPLTPEEHAIAEWLLLNASPPASEFLPQLENARVVGQCSCGCPTVYLRIDTDTPPAEPRNNPVGDAVGEVGGMMVGAMMLQSGGYLESLEVYDLSEIQRPYGLPDINSLEPFHRK
jgi:hypothetical protein